jgi:hypothetical protein
MLGALGSIPKTAKNQNKPTINGRQIGAYLIPTLGDEAGGSLVQDQPGLHSKTLLKKEKKKKIHY